MQEGWIPLVKIFPHRSFLYRPVHPVYSPPPYPTQPVLLILIIKGKDERGGDDKKKVAM